MASYLAVSASPIVTPAVATLDGRPQLFDVPLDLLDLPDTLDRLDALVRSGGSHVHLGLNAHTVLMIREDTELRAALKAATMCSLDGMSCVWTARRLGLEVPGRVAGIDIMSALLGHAEAAGWSVYFLGGTAPIVDQLAETAAARHPALRIAGWRDGYFAPADADDVVAEIAATEPTVVFLGMPSPTKELFAVGQREALGAPLIVGVGGSFDVLSGVRRRAPGWMQRAGLEWSYRLWQEPRRMAGRYLVGNPRFVALAAREVLVRRRTG